jgi:hypothetical protein
MVRSHPIVVEEVLEVTIFVISLFRFALSVPPKASCGGGDRPGRHTQMTVEVDVVGHRAVP